MGSGESCWAVTNNFSSHIFLKSLRFIKGCIPSRHVYVHLLHIVSFYFSIKESTVDRGGNLHITSHQQLDANQSHRQPRRNEAQTTSIAGIAEGGSEQIH